MPKFCSQCGAQISDDSAFCGSCGAKLADVENQTADTPVVEENTEVLDNAEVVSEANASDTASATVKEGIFSVKDKIGDGYEKFKTSHNRDKYIGFAAIGIVVLVIICVILSFIFGGGYKDAVKDYIDHSEDAYYSLQPAFLDKEANIDYDILDKEKFDKDQLAGLEESLQEQYGDEVDKTIKVSKAFEVKVKEKIITKTGGEKDTEIEKVYFIVAKVNGVWSVVGTYSDSMIDLYES